MNRTAFLAGATYTAIGLTSWRVAAFVVSGIVFAIHIGYEHFRRRRPAKLTAWHASAGAALGGGSCQN